MPQKRLQPDEIDFIKKMQKVKYSNCEIARGLGVTEGAVRYQRKRLESGLADKRRQKKSGVAQYEETIKSWVEAYEEEKTRPSFKVLYDHLKEECGYKQSYDALRRFIRKAFPKFSERKARIRIETPPGVLLQVDWKEDVKVQLGRLGNWIKVQALVFILCFSRKLVIIFTDRKDIKAFLSSHQEAFEKFGGLCEFIRPDCLKAAITRWNGKQTIVNQRYSSYLSRLSIEVFASRPGKPTDKGKVEKKIRDVFSRLNLSHRVYQDLEDLQGKTDEKLAALEKEWRCGVTGLSVAESFAYEQKYLRKLPQDFPVLPVDEKIVKVRNDGTVFFCKNYYQVGGEYRGKSVYCMNTGRQVVIYSNGEMLVNQPYLPSSRGMVMLSEKALSEPSIPISERVRNWGLEVARRQVEIYHEIIGGLPYHEHSNNPK